MNAAMARGQTSLPAFLARLNSPRRGDANFFVKYNLVPGGKAEFIWASDLTYRNGKLSGRLANAPLATGFSEGQAVTIPLPAVVDWGYTRGAVMQGHYTTRVLFKTMAPGEVDALRAAFGWSAGLPD